MNTSSSNMPDPTGNTSPDQPDLNDRDHVMPADDETLPSATTPPEDPAAGFFRRRWIPVTAIAIVAVVLVAVGGISVTKKVQQDQVAAALASRQQAINTAMKLQEDDRAGQANYGTAHENALSLHAQVTKLHADAAAGAFLTPDQVEALRAEASALETATQHKPGTPVAPLPTLGAKAAPIDRVKADTSKLQKHASTEKKNHITTLEATKKTTTQLEHTETLLTSFITGTPATETTAELPALPTVAESIAVAHPKAGVPELNEFIAVVTAAIDGINTGQPPAPLLQAYLDRAAVLKAAHHQVAEQEAREAAQQAGADSYTDPSTGQTKTTPKNTKPNGTGGNGAGAGGNTGGGSGGSGGGGAVVDKSLRINVGMRVDSCPAERPVAYSFSQSASYGSYLTVPSYWLSYNTADTGSGWRVDGMYCDTW